VVEVNYIDAKSHCYELTVDTLDDCIDWIYARIYGIEDCAPDAAEICHAVILRIREARLALNQKLAEKIQANIAAEIVALAVGDAD
jgi:hypothetical protein